MKYLFNKVTDWRAATLLKRDSDRDVVCNFIEKRLQHKCFPVTFMKFVEHIRTAAFSLVTTLYGVLNDLILISLCTGMSDVPLGDK